MKAEHTVNIGASFQGGSVSGEGEVNVSSRWMVDPTYTEFRTARVDNWNGVQDVSIYVSHSVVRLIRLKARQFGFSILCMECRK